MQCDSSLHTIQSFPTTDAFLAVHKAFIMKQLEPFLADSIQLAKRLGLTVIINKDDQSLVCRGQCNSQVVSCSSSVPGSVLSSIEQFARFFCREERAKLGRNLHRAEKKVTEKL